MELEGKTGLVRVETVDSLIDHGHRVVVTVFKEGHAEVFVGSKNR